jgi:hypothetical protein
MAGLLYRLSEEETLVAGINAIDLSTVVGVHEIPQFMGFAYWISTPGGILAVGGLAVDFRWLDIQGELRAVSGTTLGLQDNTAAFHSPMNILVRQSDSAQMDLNVQVSGPTADGAKMRYALIFSPGCSEGNSPF